MIGGGEDIGYSRELFEQTAEGVKDGRAHIYPNWGHNRTCMSSTTTNMMLGFMLASRVKRSAHAEQAVVLPACRADRSPAASPRSRSILSALSQRCGAGRGRFWGRWPL